MLGQMSMNCQYKWLFDLNVGLRNFRKLFNVSWKDFVLHGYDSNRWEVKSCITTAYHWLFQDTRSSLKTLWSAVIKSPNFSARGTRLRVRLLQRVLVTFVPLAYFVISFLRKLSENTKSVRYHFSWRIRICVKRCACGCLSWYCHSFVY